MTIMHADLHTDSQRAEADETDAPRRRGVARACSPITKRIALLSALVITLALPVVACSGSPTYTRTAGPSIGAAPAAADPRRGIMDRDEYEHSPSYPPG